jgi:RND family efflux transporter MFP subunit
MATSRKNPMKVRSAAAILVIAAVAGVAFTACRAQKAADASDTLAPVVIGPENITVVAETTLVDGPPISGALGAEREARVRAELGGSVLQVLVEPGQAVKAGQVLAQIEPQTAREQSAFTDALVRSLQNDLRLQQRNLERDKRLAEAGAVSTRAVEADSLAVSQAEASLAEANARQVVARRSLDRSTVRAPFAGIVSDRTISVGDVVRAGTELFTIVDPTSLRLEAQVPAEALQRLKVGTPVQFTLSGFRGDALTGRVSRIYPAVDPATRQVKILVAVPNPRQQLVVGLYAEGRVITASRKGLTVPQGAVDLRGVRPMVVQLKDGRLTHTEVTTGLEDTVAEQVEIASGLAVGDTIVLGTARGIPEGTPARVQAAAERSTAAR